MNALMERIRWELIHGNFPPEDCKNIAFFTTVEGDYIIGSNQIPFIVKNAMLLVGSYNV